MKGRRVETIAGAPPPVLVPGDYAKVDEVWWACPPRQGSLVAIAEDVVEHGDGTITATVRKNGRQYRIRRGSWSVEGAS